MRALRRAVAASTGLGLALLLGELGLRAAYPAAPPSLAALAAADPGALARRDPADLAGCRDGGPSGAMTGERPPQGVPYLYVVGDSVAAGWGVDRESGFAQLLQKDLYVATRGNVGLVNDAVPGAGLCEEVARAQRRLATSRQPDWAVMAVFADDLDTHGAMYVGDRLVAWPENGLSPSLAAVARGSWLVNLAWYASVSRSPGRLDASLRPEDRALYVHALQTADAALSAAPTRRVWVLLAAAGMVHCAPDAAPTTRCGRLRDGAGALKALFAAAGVPLADLTGVWNGKDYGGVDAPRDAGSDEVPIHPTAAGHRVLADAILPLLVGDASPP